MENIIEKLSQIDNSESTPFKNWTMEERKQLLELYLLISRKESKIFQLIYNFNGTDCYEDIFRDYDRQYLKDKIDGVLDAIDMMNEKSEQEESEKPAEVIQPQEKPVEIIKPSISTEIETEIEDLIKLLKSLRNYNPNNIKYCIINNTKYEINPDLYDLLTTENINLSSDNKKSILKTIDFEYMYYINKPNSDHLLNIFSNEQLLKIKIYSLYVARRKKEMEYYESLPPEYAEIFKNNNYDNIFELVKDKLILQLEKLYEKQAELYSKK